VTVALGVSVPVLWCIQNMEVNHEENLRLLCLERQDRSGIL
jgi:hypothetical protein